MKKKVLFVAAILIGATTFAQVSDVSTESGLTSRKGEAFLPEAGDYAIGFDGAPFLNYIGNFANGSASNSLSLNNNYNTFFGKMFVDANTAYRAKLRIGMGSTSSTVMVPDVATPANEVENKTTVSNGLTFVVGGGLEKRRGNGRLQGVYGAQALFGLIGGGKTTYDYGNALSVTNPGTQTTESKNGNTLTFGVEGFAGVEYFILPKFSLGTEVTWGLGFQSTGKSETTTETFTTSLESETVSSGTSSSFYLDNSVGANFKVLFHF